MTAVPLGPDLGIASAEDLKARLADHIDRPDAVQLDAGQVDRVHTASLQLLCAFVRDRQRSGQQTRIHPVAPELQAAAQTLGLQRALGLEDEA